MASDETVVAIAAEAMHPPNWGPLSGSGCRCYEQARAALAALERAGYVIVRSSTAPTEEEPIESCLGEELNPTAPTEEETER